MERLIHNLSLSFSKSIVTNQPLYLDVPQANPAAVTLAEHHGLVPVFETARMYNLADPGLPLNRISGITTFELG